MYFYPNFLYIYNQTLIKKIGVTRYSSQHEIMEA